MKFVPYNDYKPSGVEWLGDIPAHWSIERAKWLFEKMDRPVREEDEVVTCFRDGVVTLRKNRRVLGFTESLKEIGYQGIRCGDLVIHAMDAFAGAIGVADADGKGTPVYSVCKPEPRVNAYFYAYILREMARNQWIQALAKGIRERSSDFRYTEFALQPVPVPPLSEQIAIIRYLDHTDERIRRYISSRERLIELLEEYRQAVIHHAVTRGVDPDVRLKSSGVEWLGDVPEHWEVRRLKRVASLNPSKTESRTFLTADTPVTFLPMERVGTDGKIDEKVVSASVVWNGFTYFRKDDILVAKITPCFENGKGACLDSLSTEIGFGSTEFHVLRSGFSILPQFLYRLTTLAEFRCSGAEEMTGAAGQQRVPQTFVANYPIPVPPHPEQTAIVRYLDKATADVDADIDRARREIELLGEYRTRLIADVVTGKVDCARGSG